MDKNKLNKIANFLEELSWLIDSNKVNSLKEVSKSLRTFGKEENYKFNVELNDDGKSYLVGILPKILQDNYLFKTNSEMLDFSEQVLQLKPSRASKRSRIEYIGWIVCEVSNTSNKNLNNLYKSLQHILSDDSKIKKIKQAKKDKDKFSWNEIIRSL